MQKGSLKLHARASFENHPLALRAGLLGLRRTPDEKCLFAASPVTDERSQHERPEHNYFFADRQAYQHILSETGGANASNALADFKKFATLPRTIRAAGFQRVGALRHSIWKSDSYHRLHVKALRSQQGPKTDWYARLDAEEAALCRARGPLWQTLRHLERPEAWARVHASGCFEDWKKPCVTERLKRKSDTSGFDWHSERWYMPADLRGRLPEDPLCMVRIYQVCTMTGLVLRMADFSSVSTPHRLLYNAFDYDPENQVFLCGPAIYRNPFAPHGEEDRHDGTRTHVCFFRSQFIQTPCDTPFPFTGGRADRDRTRDAQILF